MFKYKSHLIILSSIFTLFFSSRIVDYFIPVHSISIFNNYVGKFVEYEPSKFGYMILDYEFFHENSGQLEINDIVISIAGQSFTGIVKVNNRYELFNEISRLEENKIFDANELIILRQNSQMAINMDLSEKHSFIQSVLMTLNSQFLVSFIFMLIGTILILKSNEHFISTFYLSCILLSFSLNFAFFDNLSRFSLIKWNSIIGITACLFVIYLWSAILIRFPQNEFKNNNQKIFVKLSFFITVMVILFYVYSHFYVTNTVDISFSLAIIWMIFSLILGLLFLLKNYYSIRENNERKKIKILFFSFLFAILPLLILQLIPNIFSFGQIVRGNSLIFLILIPIGLMISIYKYQLFNIDNLVRRSTIYSISAIIIFVLYLMIAFILYEFIGNRFAIISEYTYAISALLAAMMLNPIKNKATEILDKTFKSETYNFKESILEFSKSASNLISLTDLLESIVKLLYQKLRIKKVAIYLEYIDSYAIHECEGLSGGELNTLIKILKDDQLNTLLLESEIIYLDKLNLSEGTIHNFKQSGFKIIIPIIIKKNISGFLILADREFNNEYQNDEIELLLTLTKQFTISLDNALVYSRMQELNLLLEDKVRDRTKELREKNELLEKVNDIVKKLNSEITLNDLFSTIITEMLFIHGTERVALLLYNEEKDCFEYKASIYADHYKLNSVILDKETAYNRFLKNVTVLDDNIYLINDFSNRAGNHLYKGLPIPKSQLVLTLRLNQEIKCIILLANFTTISAFDLIDLSLIKNLRENINSVFIKTQLLEEVQEAIIELNSTQSQLVHAEKMSALGQMVAGIAHEMNTPLAFVKNNIQLIEMKLEMIKEEALNNEWDSVYSVLINDTLSGVQRLIELVKSLRNFSRIDDLDKRVEFNIKDCIMETLNISKYLFKEHNIKVDSSLENVPNILCNPSNINQVFLNIITNACHAMAEHNTEIQSQLKIRLFADNHHVIAKFQDNGGGIPMEIKEKIFEPFFTTKKLGKGTGLGLSISYKIIKDHQGDIILNVAPNESTEFIIKLPLQSSK